jgi:hypothetical protein
MGHTTTHGTYQVVACRVALFRHRSDRKLPQTHFLARCHATLPHYYTIVNVSSIVLCVPHFHLNATGILTPAQVDDVELHSMTDAAAEPLISNNREDPDDARYREDDIDDVEVDESALVSPGLFIWGLTVCAGVSGLLFGYEYVESTRGSPCANLP